MTTIPSSMAASAAPPLLDGLGPEASVEALLTQLANAELRAEHDRAQSNEHRFERAAASLDHKRHAIRAQMIASVLTGVGTLGGAVTSMVQAFSSGGGSASEGAGEGSSSGTTARRIAATAQTVSEAGRAASSILGIRASASQLRAETEDLASNRAEARERLAGEHAQTERSLRETLLRELESLMSQRHRADDTLVGRQR